jgi:NAD(P)H-nitrite reductase large subunit
MIHSYLAGIGMTVQYKAEAATLAGEDTVSGLVLRDGRELPCDLFLAAVGIRPNAELAEQAGIAVNRGILVNDRMETTAPGVFAAGDVAEHDGRVLGLWPIAAKQGEVAAVNALGGDARLTAEIPATILKGVGIDLYSIGKITPGPGDEIIAHENPAAPAYRWLLVSEGRAAGAIVLGHDPDLVASATAAVKNRAELDNLTRARLIQGDWAALKEAGRVSAPAGA